MIAALFTTATNTDPDTGRKANPGVFVERSDSQVRQYDSKEVTPRRKTVQPTRNQSKNPSRRRDKWSDTLLDTHLSGKSPVRRREKPLRQNLSTNQ
jgi:hypothetical protein